MAIRKIVVQGDEILSKVCKPVTAFDQKLHTLLDDMADTLRQANGAGLAAPQVGILRRVVVVSDDGEEILELINPEIVATEGEQTGPEGCLSVPGKCGMVTRPYRVRVRAQDRNGNWFEAEGEELMARAFCHELEHLDGHLYVEHIDHFLRGGADGLLQRARLRHGGGCGLMRIVFMGTPDFAVPSLRRLIADGHEVVAVFTQPDKPKNRGMKLIPTPVKAAAMEAGIPVYQPTTVRDEAVLEEIRRMAPDLLAVAAYGKILPEALLRIPTVAAINVHSSLLPKYRGAAPINWAILNGDEETGVTIQHLGVELDAGDIITVHKTPIDPQEDAAQLYTRLAELGAEALSEAVSALADGTARRIPQGEAEGPYAAMLSKEMSPIDWNKNAQTIVIR